MEADPVTPLLPHISSSLTLALSHLSHRLPIHASLSTTCTWTDNLVGSCFCQPASLPSCLALDHLSVLDHVSAASLGSSCLCVNTHHRHERSTAWWLSGHITSVLIIWVVPAVGVPTQPSSSACHQVFVPPFDLAQKNLGTLISLQQEHCQHNYSMCSAWQHTAKRSPSLSFISCL